MRIKLTKNTKFMVRMTRFVTNEQRAINIGLREFIEQPLFLDLNEEE